jgi:hypothetical protein
MLVFRKPALLSPTSTGMEFIIVADGEVGGCVDHERKGVIMGRGAEGGPSPPGGELDQQLICNSGGGETPMGKQGGQQDGSDAASRTHHAQSM